VIIRCITAIIVPIHATTSRSKRTIIEAGWALFRTSSILIPIIKNFKSKKTHTLALQKRHLIYTRDGGGTDYSSNYQDREDRETHFQVLKFGFESYV
jgi:hypothetical protein